MIPHQIEPWRRRQRGQFRDEIKGFEDYTDCSVSPPVPESIGHTSVRENRKTFSQTKKPLLFAAKASYAKGVFFETFETETDWIGNIGIAAFSKVKGRQ
jgi:hypothetical protein